MLVRTAILSVKIKNGLRNVLLMIVLNLPYSITVKKVAEVKWNIVGQHNMHNALMAIAAAYHADVKIEDACQALGSFINAKRRLEVKGGSKRYYGL